MKHSKRLFKSLFYVPKYEKVSEKSLSRIMLSSVFGILLCGICLAGLTWAWFTGSVSSTANTITAADFSVGVEFKQNELVIEPAIENESYKLNSGTYKVTITADGSATTGYCKVEYGEKTYYTVPLFTNSESDTVEFTVYASGNSELKITPQWGTCAVPATAESPRIWSRPADEGNHIVNSIGTPPEATTTAEASEQSAGTEAANTPTGTEQTATEEDETDPPETE